MNQRFRLRGEQATLKLLPFEPASFLKRELEARLDCVNRNEGGFEIAVFDSRRLAGCVGKVRVDCRRAKFFDALASLERFFARDLTSECYRLFHQISVD